MKLWLLPRREASSSCVSLQLVQKGFIAFGLFKIIQILTLKVFNNSHQCGIGVNRGVVNYTERFFRPKAPQRTQTAFTGDKLVCFAVFANDKGLDQSDLPNGLCKLGYAFVIKGFSRLSRVRNDGIQCQFNKLAFCLGRLCACCSAFLSFRKSNSAILNKTPNKTPLPLCRSDR